MLSVYKASAGSGKTFTLAYEFIKMLLGRSLQEEPGVYHIDSRTRERHRRLLAITFTNKATDEMKRRIVHQLAVLAGCEPTRSDKGPYMKRLTEELHTDENTVSAEARRALDELLFDYSSFNVSTIDSFFQSILRTFAREAELTGSYEVDLDSDTAMTQAVAETFRSIGEKENRRTLQWMTQVMLNKARAGESVDLFNRSSPVFGELVRFIHTLSGETYHSCAEQMQQYFSDPTRLDRFAARIQTRINELAENASQAATQTLQAIEEIKGVNRNLINKLKEWAAYNPASKLPSRGKTLASMADDPAKAFNQAARAAAVGAGLTQVVSQGCTEIIGLESQLNLLKIITSNLHFMGLTGAVTLRMEEFCRENDTLLLSDTNSILKKIVGEEDTPFVYERMGIWIDHYLIDEFQDTSTMQWEIMRPLLSEGLGEGRDSLIIGDEKQCIYRFRNSNPDLLTHTVADDLPGVTRVLGDAPGENTNWRSSRTIVEFNNRLFSAWSAASFSDIYANVEQAVSSSRSGHTGYVSVEEVDDIQASMGRMCDEISRQLRSGYRPADIVILVRNHNDATAAINAIMARIDTDPAWEGIRLISDDSITLDKSPAVRQVICGLRSMLAARINAADMADNAARRSINHTLDPELLERLINRFEDLSSKGASRSLALSRAVEAMRGDSTEADKGFAADLWDLRCPGLPTLVARLMERIISPETYDREQAFLNGFTDTVIEFVERGTGDIQSFLRWWDAKGHRTPLAAPDDDKALRIMTIHKSKGLDFRCVHIPCACWKISADGIEWFHTPRLDGFDPDTVPPIFAASPTKAMADTEIGSEYERLSREAQLDELNVAYVAFTRAVDELIVSYFNPTAANIGSYLKSAMQSICGNGSGTEGEPTMARPHEAAGKTAVDPTRAELMSAGRTSALHGALWEQIQLDPDSSSGMHRERGIMMHDILAGVNRRSDLRKAIRRLVRRGEVPLSMAESLEEQLDRLIESQSSRGWFDGYRRVLVERPLASGVIDEYGNAVRTRPDRVVWTADGYVDVIDYKTGEEHTSEYTGQVRGYMRSIKALGYTNIRGYIWYLDTDRVCQVSMPPGE